MKLRGVLSGFVDLAKLTFTFSDYLEEILRQLNRLLLGVRTEEGEAADHLFRLGEGAIGHAHLAVSGANAGAERAWHAALCGNKPAGLHDLYHELTPFS